MRLYLLILTSFLGFSNFCQGQFLHTPEEIEEILSKNPNKYQIIDQTAQSFEDFKSCRQENTPKIQSKNGIGGWYSESYIFIDKEKGPIKRKLKKKLKSIKKEKETISAKDYAQLSKWNYFLGDHEQAIYYKKLEQKTSNNMMLGNLLLAKCYHNLGKHTKALDHIIDAKLLAGYCKNASQQPDIYYQKFNALLISILRKNNLSYDQWSVKPMYCIKNNHSIEYNGTPWKAYASCKAVWKDEPGYAEKMESISNQPLLMIEEKESLLNALTAYLRLEEKVQQKAFTLIGQSLDHNFIDELIIYELYLSQNKIYPFLNQEGNDLSKLKEYFKLAHCIPITQ